MDKTRQKKRGGSFKDEPNFMRQVVSAYLASTGGYGSIAKEFNVTYYQGNT